MSEAPLGKIHALLDDLAQLVGAPALVEDAGHAVIAYSRHDDPGDSVRSSTILHRRADPAVVSWLSRHGIAEARDAVHLPANRDLGMRPRLCLPLRDGDHLLGYLWFIEEDTRLSAFELTQARSSARTLVALLSRADDGGLSLELAPVPVVRAILEGEQHQSAAVLHLQDTRLEIDGGLRVLALHPTGRPTAARLRRVLCGLSRALAPLAPLAAIVGDHGVVVYVDPPSGLDIRAVCQRVLSGRHDLVAGVGDPVPDLASLPRSRAMALDAARCGALWPELGRVVDWPGAGMYRLVPGAAAPGSPLAALVEQLAAIYDSPDLRHLALTAEAYLDLAGHAQEAAQELVLHRTTLYQRLQRFTEVTGIGLKEGPGRTLAHLALKAAQFARPVPGRGLSGRDQPKQA